MPYINKYTVLFFHAQQPTTTPPCRRTMTIFRDRITTDPAILGGKPAVRGTRLAVGFILDLLAAGWSEGRLLEAYPQLRSEDIRTCSASAVVTTPLPSPPATS